MKNGRGEAVELPAAGWLAFNPRNGLYEISANVGGHRMDYVTAPEYEFLDGRGAWTSAAIWARRAAWRCGMTGGRWN